METEIYKNLSLENLPNEEWRPIEGASKYLISNMGRVKSLPRKIKRGRGFMYRGEKILKPIINGNGYCQVTIFYDEGSKRIRNIHNLGLESFLPNPNGYKECDHINTIRTDNRIENLRWSDRTMNVRNPITVKNRKRAIQKYAHTEEFILKQRNNQPNKKNVLQYNIDGSFASEYISLSEAARSVNGEIASISRCCRGKQNTSYGYIWEYKQ